MEENVQFAPLVDKEIEHSGKILEIVKDQV